MTDNFHRVIESETNDCTVKALAFATDSDYLTVHSLLRKAGRVNGQGFYLGRYAKNRTVILGYRWKFQRYREPFFIKVKDFINLNPTGRFVIACPFHATAVVNGKCLDYDFGSADMFIMSYYKLEEF